MPSYANVVASSNPVSIADVEFLVPRFKEVLNFKSKFLPGIFEQDASIYELVHDLVSERKSPEALPDLFVVIDRGLQLFSIGNRRLAALRMFQATRMDEVVYAKCKLYLREHPGICQKYKQSFTTSADLAWGMGIRLQEKTCEAWHMGRPLFRCQEEWASHAPAATLGEAVEPEYCQRVVSGSIVTPSTRLIEQTFSATIETPCPVPIGDGVESGEQGVKDASAPGSIISTAVESEARMLPSTGLSRPLLVTPVTVELGTVALASSVAIGSSSHSASPGLASSKPSDALPSAESVQAAPTNAGVSQSADLPSLTQALNAESSSPTPSHFADENDAGSDDDDYVEAYRGDGEVDDASVLSEDDASSNHSEAPSVKVEKCRPYELKGELEVKIKNQKEVSVLADVQGSLVSGILRCLSGTDNKRKRAKCQLLVEAGPQALLGCRVHVNGHINRNRAYDWDRCWVRIFRATFDDAQGVLSQHSTFKPTSPSLATLFGRVVLAEETCVPRQRDVVCIRSKFVRSLRSLVFRAINGKFPLIKVPWNPEQQLPSLSDLHIVEVMEWREDLPLGRYIRCLNMKKRNTDQNLLHAIQISMNFAEWGERVHNEDDCINDLLENNRGDHGQLPSPRVYDRRFVPAAVGIEQRPEGEDSWPANLAFSISDSHFQVHITDANEYLDALNLESTARIERSLRTRAVGTWFSDYLDKASASSLSLWPLELEKLISFATATDRLALTFSFPLNPSTGEIKSGKFDIFESQVHCDRLYSYDEVESILLRAVNIGPSDEQLHKLLRFTCHFEEWAESEQNSAIFEHLLPDLFGSAPEESSDRRAGLHADRMVAFLSCLANHAAGRELANPKHWDAFLRPSAQSYSVSKGFMPLFVSTRPDRINHLQMCRLLSRPSSNLVGIRVGEVLQMVRGVLSEEHLAAEQKRSLQTAILRQVRNLMPYGCYLMLEGRAWPPGERVGKQELFYRERNFSVSAPLRRHLDVIGHRVLKFGRGWRPMNQCLRLTATELSETVLRTNARVDACRFADFVFKQVTLMRGLERSSWLVSRGTIGHVGPAGFEVLLPVPSRFHAAVCVPTAALRGTLSAVWYKPEEQSLELRMNESHEWGLEHVRNACWTVTKWGSGRSPVSCLVSRNFGQPIPHHAAANSIVISDLSFALDSGTVTIGIGHRMYPEVYSSIPDLKEWHMINRDPCAYARIWHSIKLCQVHAAAVADSSRYTAQLDIRQIQWFQRNDRSCFTCEFQADPRDLDARSSLNAEDLAILRCDKRLGNAVLYGTVVEASVASKRGKTLKVTVELSTVTTGSPLVDTVQRNQASGCKVQFIRIQAFEQKLLDCLRILPRLITRQRASPLSSHLLLLRNRKQRDAELEQRPLVTIQQVQRALGYPEYRCQDTNLNEHQLKAIKIGLQSPLSVVQGPPGTGKTTFLIHMIASLLNLETDPSLETWTKAHCNPLHQQHSPGKLLVCAPSNHAADEILQKLVDKTNVPPHHLLRVYARSIEAALGSKFKGRHQSDTQKDFEMRPGLEEYSLHFKTRNRPSVDRLHTSLSDDPSAAELQRYRKVYEKEEGIVVKAARVVITTCMSAVLHSGLQSKDLHFTTVVIDEAAQASEPDVVCSAMLAEERVIIVGDHKQLGPVVVENNLCTAYMKALETPLLERMYGTKGILPSNTMLVQQYRMHPSLRSFPSRQWYDSRLVDEDSRPVNTLTGAIWPEAGEHLVWVDVDTPHQFGKSFRVACNGRDNNLNVFENTTSYQNEGEVKVVTVAYERLLSYAGCRPEDIAVITPYAAQQQEIRTRLSSKFGSKAKGTSVGTVHGMQGSERDFVIISFVRSTADGQALLHSPQSTSASDVVVSVPGDHPSLRQISDANLGLLSNSKALNVALTRARKGIICIGNSKILSQGLEDFNALLKDMRERKCVLSSLEFTDLLSRRAPNVGSPGPSAAPKAAPTKTCEARSGGGSARVQAVSASASSSLVSIPAFQTLSPVHPPSPYPSIPPALTPSLSLPTSIDPSFHTPPPARSHACLQVDNTPERDDFPALASRGPARTSRRLQGPRPQGRPSIFKLELA